MAVDRRCIVEMALSVEDPRATAAPWAGGRTILVVTPTVPAPDRSGFDGRVHHLVEGLAVRHSVTVLCGAMPGDEQVVRRLRSRCRVLTVAATRPSRLAKRAAQALALARGGSWEWGHLHSAAMESALHSVMARDRFDVVQLESCRMGTLSLPGGIPVVVDEHNVESELLQRTAAVESSPGRRAYARAEAVRLGRAESDLWRRCAGCAVTSERDAAAIRREAPGVPVEVVHNGVDVVAWRPAPLPEAGPPHLVFTGTMNYRPNTDAAVHLVRDILPLLRLRMPQVRVTICGQDPPAAVRSLAGPGVVVTGRVDDVRPVVASADVVVVPLRIGAGTRLKVLEAMAAGRPVVSSSLGCEGIDVIPGRHVLVADGVATFAAAVNQAVQDRALAAELAGAGRALVERRYSWEAAVRRLEWLHARVLAAAAPAR